MAFCIVSEDHSSSLFYIGLSLLHMYSHLRFHRHARRFLFSIEQFSFIWDESSHAVTSSNWNNEIPCSFGFSVICWTKGVTETKFTKERFIMRALAYYCVDNMFMDRHIYISYVLSTKSFFWWENVYSTR